MIYIKLDARFVTPPPSYTLCSKLPLGQYWLISLNVLWLAFRCNREWFNYAYATYHGRFGKTIGE